MIIILLMRLCFLRSVYNFTAMLSVYSEALYFIFVWLIIADRQDEES